MNDDGQVLCISAFRLPVFNLYVLSKSRGDQVMTWIANMKFILTLASVNASSLLGRIQKMRIVVS